jgi:valyl-tRNA synthetase
MGKISKSRGGGPMPPLEMIERYSADAVRYWAASTGPGKDSVISEEKVQNGARLATKLWNVAQFSARFLQPDLSIEINPLVYTPADRWILARLQQVIRHTTDQFENYDYASAKSEVEDFFWRDLADNYLEMCKLRLYDSDHPQRPGALQALQHVLLDTLKLFAPILPFVTEEIYQGLFASSGAISSPRSNFGLARIQPSFGRQASRRIRHAAGTGYHCCKTLQERAQPGAKQRADATTARPSRLAPRQIDLEGSRVALRRSGSERRHPRPSSRAGG